MSLNPSDQPKRKSSDFDFTKQFDIFIKEGNVFGVRKEPKKISTFVPPSPDVGLDRSFNAEQLSIKNKTRSAKLTKRFFDF